MRSRATAKARRSASPTRGSPCARDGQALELSASVEVEAAKLRVALCVVIEELDGALSYWALAHPAPRPTSTIRDAASRWSIA